MGIRDISRMPFVDRFTKIFLYNNLYFNQLIKSQLT